MQVVQATEDHLEDVLNIWTMVAAEGKWIGTELPLRPDWSEGFLASFDNPTQQWFVAMVEDQVVGALVVYSARGVADLGMAIVDGYRGQGIGRALIDGAIDWAREKNCHKIELEVWPHNERALRLYSAAGFRFEGSRRRHYRRRNGELWDSIAMAIVLDTESPGSPYEPVGDELRGATD